MLAFWVVFEVLIGHVELEVLNELIDLVCLCLLSILVDLQNSDICDLRNVYGLILGIGFSL